MSRFATIAHGQAGIGAGSLRADGGMVAGALIWEKSEDGHFRVVERVQDVGTLVAADGSSELEIWNFEVPTTDMTGIGPNKGRHAVLDADGSPLWANARITFRLQSHYINTMSGAGTFQEADRYGGVRYLSDEKMTIYDRRGFAVDSRRENYSSIQTYVVEGELKGCRMLTSKLGDPHEHGQVETFIRLASDPRDVCKLVIEPPAPRP